MMVLIVIIYFIIWGLKLILKIMDIFFFVSYVFEEDENEGFIGGMELDFVVVIFLFFEFIFIIFFLVSLILNFLIFVYYNKVFCEDL